MRTSDVKLNPDQVIKDTDALAALMVGIYGDNCYIYEADEDANPDEIEFVLPSVNRDNPFDAMKAMPGFKILTFSKGNLGNNEVTFFDDYLMKIGSNVIATAVITSTQNDDMHQTIGYGASVTFEILGVDVDIKHSIDDAVHALLFCGMQEAVSKINDLAEKYSAYFGDDKAPDALAIDSEDGRSVTISPLHLNLRGKH